MAHIKKMVMQGFKSFAPKTEIIFDKGINVIIGPNGSGKSNISDALCFVLGRISSKSMRASKTKNLLFMGTQYAKPASEASVELVFDNADKIFAMDKDEVSIARSVRKNGMSIYKINGETKTRAEVLEALAQAGIDPHGFNLVLQGQIQSIVKMHPEERREVIEEVAGIRVYESRKEKAKHELDKTEERLKEINSVLRERAAYLKNLENERTQALKFKDLELSVKRCRASILTKRLQEKEKELAALKKSIAEQNVRKDNIRKDISEQQERVEKINVRIAEINRHIQRATGIEQETLKNQISNLRAELEGSKVRRENFQNKKEEIQRKIDEMQKSMPELEKEIQQLKIESPILVKKREELARKKQELAEIEDERKKIYAIKTELAALKDRIRDKQNHLNKTNIESSSIMKQIEDYAMHFTQQDAESCKNHLLKIEKKLTEQKSALDSLNKGEIEHNRIISSFESDVRNASKVREQVRSIDVCPLCKNKMTEEHLSHVMKDTGETIEGARKHIDRAKLELEGVAEERQKIRSLIADCEKEIYKTERELTQHLVVKDKHDMLKRLVAQEEQLKKEIAEFEQKKVSIEQKTNDVSRLDELYMNKMLEIEEASSMTEQDVDRMSLTKERELERMREIIKLSRRDLGAVMNEMSELEKGIGDRIAMLREKEKEESAMNEQFKKLFKERDDLQTEMQNHNYGIAESQNAWRQLEEQINFIKVGDAKVSAEKEAVEMELVEFQGVELVNASLAQIEERLQKAQESLRNIGSINMRALEIYEEIKLEYDRVQEKVNVLSKEKEDILNIIAEIDAKKKRTFMKTFNGINEIFSSNFSRLSTKGQAFLEVENEESIFEGGVNIVIKMGKGKYFDVTSLSGGEQTLIALSLLFAIQEFKPYHFYVFDEIDAALDKRNSERLSALLQQYMKSGQYITITHNDALIMDANLLYGVSMHDGISKVLSLKLGDSPAGDLSGVTNKQK